MGLSLSKAIDFLPPKIAYDVVSGNETNATSMIPGIGDAAAQERANKANMNESALNRQFQKDMSNTAYQRAMADMKAAGLNPTLAYMQGGASTPSGSTATAAPATKTGLADFALRASTGISAAQQQATAVQSQVGVNESAKVLNGANAAKAIAEEKLTNVKAEIAKKDIPRAQLENDLASKAANMVRKGIDTFTSTASQLKERFERYHGLDDRAVKRQQDEIRKMRERSKK